MTYVFFLFISHFQQHFRGWLASFRFCLLALSSYSFVVFLLFALAHLSVVLKVSILVPPVLFFLFRGSSGLGAWGCLEIAVAAAAAGEGVEPRSCGGGPAVSDGRRCTTARALFGSSVGWNCGLPGRR